MPNGTLTIAGKRSSEMNLALPHSRNWFYTSFGVVIIAIVVVGFSRTYYLKAWFDASPLTVKLQLHGFALSAWLVLFFVQARLIAAHRRTLHKRLGIAGALLAGLAVATTYAAVFEAAALAAAQDSHTALTRMYSGMELSTLFGLFVAAGIVFRKRLEIHRRFMVLAMLAAVGPGAHRAVTLIAGHIVRDPHIWVIAVLLIGALAYDWRTRGAPHPILFWGGALLIALQMTRRLVGGTDVWQHIGRWLLNG
jgi:hypothetical protein